MSPKSDPSLHFKVLGSIDLRRADGSQLLSLLSHPKRIALLTYVAMEAPGGFVSRERVMSVFWPDSDDARARQSLRNSLYQIRQSAGAGALMGRGSTEVGVDPELMSVDAVALRAAVAERRFQEAAELYEGPFLSGFHLDGAPEFEEWAGRTRAIIEVDALRAFSEAARAQEASGDPEAAQRLLRRAQEIAPADEEILRHRLLLLEQLGNRAKAVAEGEEWIERLRSSLEIEPSEPTLLLMEELRTGTSVGAPPPAPVAPASGSSETPVTPTSPPPSPAPPVPAPPRRAGRWTHSLALRWLPAAAILAVLVWMVARRPSPSLPIEGGVVVEPFEADSAAGGRMVGVALGALTARYLQPETGGLVLPAGGIAAAASFDGRNRRLILGRVQVENGRLVAHVGLTTTGRPGKILAEVTASVEDRDLETLAIRLVDAMARQNGLSLPGRGPVPRFTRAPGAIPPFFRGEMLARAGRTQEASDAYRQAIALDSTFAMAYYRLAVMESLLGRENALRTADRAVDLSMNLTGGERKLLDAWRTYQTGGVEMALPRYEALAESRGPDPEVWLRLAELQFHWGPQLGIPRDSVTASFRHLLRLVPDDSNALLHLIRLLGPSADPAPLAEAVRHLDASGAPEDMRIEAEAIVALNRRRTPGARVAEWIAGGSISLEARRLEQLAASARFPYDLAPFVRALPPTDDPFRRVLRRLLLAQLAASSGRMGEAYRELDTLSAFQPYRAVEYRAFLALSDPVPAPADTLRSVRRRLRSIPDSAGPPISIWTATQSRPDLTRTLVLDAMLTLRLGEPVDMDGLLARGRAASHYFDPTRTDYLQAELYNAEGDPARVLTVLGPGAPEWSIYADPFSYLVATSKWTRIQSLVALGRSDEALRWLGTIPDAGGYDLAYIAPASLLRGRILERLGRNARAATAYRYAAEMWSNADPAFHSLVDEAQRGAERTGAGPAG